MGNPMTPFLPPAAAFVPSIIKILASTADAITFNINLTDIQAKSSVFFISGTSTNLGGGPYICLPTNAPAQVYTLVVDAVTTGTTGNVMGLGHVGGGGGVVSFYPSLVYQFAHFPSGPFPGNTYFQRASATNIAYP